MLTGTTRSQNIFSRVSHALGLVERTDRDWENIIFTIASDYAIEIAESKLCVESSLSLVTTGASSYDLSTISSIPTGFYRLRLIVPPSNSITMTEEVDIEIYDQISRFSHLTMPRSVIGYKLVGTTLSMYPAPDSGTYTIHFFKSPTTSISRSVAPETPSAFDQAIIYGTCADVAVMSGNDKLVSLYEEKYERALAKAVERYRSTKSIHHQIEYQDI